MCAKSADKAFEKIVDRLGQAQSVLAVTHARPDGDGLGSVVALAKVARAAGKTARILLPDTVPPRYQFLFADEQPSAGPFPALADQADVIAVLDTCAFAQLNGLEEALRRRRPRLIVIDHHATADDVADVQWIDTSAAATAVMLGEIFAALDWPVGFAAAEALVTAVTSDTGWLRYANTDARALHSVAKWLEAGVRTDRLYKKLYERDRPERIRLMVRMLESLELACQGRLAVMTIREADFQQTGARPSETENLINEALRMDRVETVILLVEKEDCVRVSLRSRDAVDVSVVASRFGGGGHPRAAGFRCCDELDELKRRLVAVCAQELAGADSA